MANVADGEGVFWQPPARFERDIAFAMLASLALHLLVSGLLALGPQREPPAIAAPPVIEIDLLPYSEPAAPVVPAPPLIAPLPAAQGEAQAPVSPPATPASGYASSATQFFAGAIVTDPSNRAVFEGFVGMALAEQLIQICNIEGIEQIRASDPDLPADTIVPYAFADMRRSGSELRVEGGAVRIRERWYALRFRCRAAPDAHSVAEFEFSIGDAIPESEWEQHYLNRTDE